MPLRRGKAFMAVIRIETRELYRTSRLVSHLTGVHIQPNKAIIGANAFAHESGIHQHGMLSNRKLTMRPLNPLDSGRADGAGQTFRAACL